MLALLFRFTFVAALRGTLTSAIACTYNYKDVHIYLVPVPIQMYMHKTMQ